MADATKKSRGKKGNKRMIRGRKKRQCESYRKAGKREINKATKLRRHVSDNPADTVAWSTLTDLAAIEPRSCARSVLAAAGRL